MSGYWNEVDAKETREIIRNDSFFTRQQNALDEAGGRFAKINPTKVTGAEPISQVPHQPAGSPYADNPVPPGDAIDRLGFDVNEMEPVGSLTEIQKSIVRLDAPDSGSDISAVAVEREPEPSSLINALTDGDGSTDRPATALDPSDVVSAEGPNELSPSLVRPQPSSRFKRRF